VSSASSGSLLLKPGIWLIEHLRNNPQIQESYLVRRSETLALWSAILLFLSSPYVGTGLNALGVLVTFGFLLLGVLKQQSVKWHPLDTIVLLYLCVHCVAVFFSPFLIPSIKGMSKMMVYFASYWSFRQLFRKDHVVDCLLGALFMAGFVEAAYGIAQWFMHVEPLANWEDPEALEQLTRVYSTLKNPNLLAAYLIPIFPLAVASALTFKTRVMKLLALSTAVVSPICIFFTYSRGAYLGIVASIVVFVLAGVYLGRTQIQANPKLKWGLISSAGAVVLGLGLKIATSSALQARLGSITATREHSSNSFRMNVWTGVLNMAQDSLWTGIGIGNTAFRKMYSLYMISGFEALGAYNILLEVLVEMGIIGAVVFLGLWLYSLVTSYQTFTSPNSTTKTQWLTLAASSGLVGTWVMGMVDTVYYRPSVQILFWFLLALIVYGAQQKSTSLK
jgi:putative inorganic carbon (hco3(-)) transporter